MRRGLAAVSALSDDSPADEDPCSLDSKITSSFSSGGDLFFFDRGLSLVGMSAFCALGVACDAAGCADVECACPAAGALFLSSVIVLAEASGVLVVGPESGPVFVLVPAALSMRAAGFGAVGATSCSSVGSVSVSGGASMEPLADLSAFGLANLLNFRLLWRRATSARVM